MNRSPRALSSPSQTILRARGQAGVRRGLRRSLSYFSAASAGYLSSLIGNPRLSGYLEREEAITAVENFIRRSRLGLEPNWKVTREFARLWDSRFDTRQRREKVALNEVVVEALSLAYHGARAQDPNLNLTPRAAGDRRCADRSRNRGDMRLLAEFGFARSGRLRCDADRQLATPPRPQKRILPCSGLRK